MLKRLFFLWALLSLSLAVVACLPNGDPKDRCEDATHCQEGYLCHQERCRPDCALGCPEGTQCVRKNEVHLCSGGGVDEPCMNISHCQPGFICLAADNKSPGTCRSQTISGHRVVRFDLLNADKDEVITGYSPLSKEQTLALNDLPTRNLSVRAVVEPEVVGSVRFDLNDTEGYVTENLPPYLLKGDNTQGDVTPWVPEATTYRITATPFTSMSGSGDPGEPLSITVIFTDSSQS